MTNKSEGGSGQSYSRVFNVLQMGDLISMWVTGYVSKGLMRRCGGIQLFARFTPSSDLEKAKIRA